MWLPKRSIHEPKSAARSHSVSQSVSQTQRQLPCRSRMCFSLLVCRCAVVHQLVEQILQGRTGFTAALTGPGAAAVGPGASLTLSCSCRPSCCLCSRQQLPQRLTLALVLLQLHLHAQVHQNVCANHYKQATTSIRATQPGFAERPQHHIKTLVLKATPVEQIRLHWLQG